MLSQYVSALKNSIHWAHSQDDIDILRLAREHMDRAMHFVASIDCSQQQQAAYRAIDDLLPMEWPLWMEACRCGDEACTESATLH